MKSRRTRAEDVLPNITARKPPKSSPGCGRMVPSAVVWRYLQRARYKTSCNRTDHSFAARRWWECTARFCPWWPWPLTLTFKLARVRDQTRLPREFGANPFSHSRDILFTKKRTKRQKVTDSGKNITLRSLLRAVESSCVRLQPYIRFIQNTCPRHIPLPHHGDIDQ